MATDKKKKPKAYALREYPKVVDIEFPRELPIAFAVCGVKCGNRAFIVDGSTQVCDYCGRLMFRTEVKSYIIQAPKKSRRSDARVSRKNA